LKKNAAGGFGLHPQGKFRYPAGIIGFVGILCIRRFRENQKKQENGPVSILVISFILVSQSVSSAVPVLSVRGWEIACKLFHLLCHELFQFYVVIFYRKEACFRVRPAPPR
jgi:hypothetical protein